MSLKYLILEKSKKDIILDKIGLSEGVYKVIKKYIPQKYQIWVADNILLTCISAVFQVNVESRSDAQSLKSRYKNEDGHKKEAVENMLKSYELNRRDSIEYQYGNFIHQIIQNNNTPKLKLKEIFTYEDVIKKMEEWTSIRDWYHGATPRPNLPSMDWDEAYEQSEEWHEEMEASGKQLGIKEGQIMIHKFDDGYYWLDLGTSNCDDEGDAMGHCANTQADTLLSLRDEHGEPHVTVAYNYGGVYRQIKGKRNDKPDDKYHPYIVELFINGKIVDNKTYIFEEYKPEYDPESDFNIHDLDEKSFEKVIENVDKHQINSLLKYTSISDLLDKVDYDIIKVDINQEDSKKLEDIGDKKSWIETVKMSANYHKADKLLNKLNLIDKDDYKKLKNSEFIFSHHSDDKFSHNNKEKLIPFIINNRKIIVVNFWDNYNSLELFYK